MIVGVKGLEAAPYRNNISIMIRKLNQLGVPSKELLYHEFAVWDTYDDEGVSHTAKRLYKKINDGDSIVAHSFGGLVTIRLLNEMHKFGKPKKLKNIFMFNPSADQMIKINEDYFEDLYLFFDPEDKLLRLAMWLPFNDLGALGKFGYRHMSKKIHSIKIKPGKAGWYNHDRFTYEPNLTRYAKFIKKRE